MCSIKQVRHRKDKCVLSQHVEAKNINYPYSFTKEAENGKVVNTRLSERIREEYKKQLRGEIGLEKYFLTSIYL